MEREKTKELKEKFLQQLLACKGFITTTCRRIGIHRNTYYLWCKDDPEFAESCEEIIDLMGDFVENKLFENIQNNDTTAIKFCLSTKYKHRGYAEKENTVVNVNSGFSEEDLSILETYIQKEVANRLQKNFKQPE